MKLVDILARELEEWPEGATSMCQSDNCKYVYVGGAKGFHLSERAEDREDARVTRAEWQAARDALMDTKTESLLWNGSGLPPVGAVCEINVSGEWHEGTITYTSKNVVVWKWCSQDPGHECCKYIHEIQLRPIRTPEQIKADERLHKISNACTDIISSVEKYNLNLECSAAIRFTVEAMIDAGYRKQEAQ